MASANAYAVLIGVDQCEVERWRLPGVLRDVEALRSVLTDRDRCGYPVEQVRVTTGEAATRAGILESIEWLRHRLANDPTHNATAVVYYSGHGCRDREVDPPAHYLIPYDVSEQAFRQRALPAEDFAKALSSLDTRRVLVLLDCCHAGGMGAKHSTIPPPPTASAWQAAATSFSSSALPPDLLVADVDDTQIARASKGLEKLSVGAGRAVLASSRGGQISYLRKDESMSIFTYHLIEALTGHAQSEAGATEVLVSDVMSHISRRVPKSAWTDWQQEQEPDYRVSGNFPIALLLGGKGLSQGQAPPDPLTALAGHRADPADAVRGNIITSVGDISNSYGIAIGPGASSVVRHVDKTKRPKK